MKQFIVGGISVLERRRWITAGASTFSHTTRESGTFFEGTKRDPHGRLNIFFIFLNQTGERKTMPDATFEGCGLNPLFPQCAVTFGASELRLLTVGRHLRSHRRLLACRSRAN